MEFQISCGLPSKQTSRHCRTPSTEVIFDIASYRPLEERSFVKSFWNASKRVWNASTCIVFKLQAGMLDAPGLDRTVPAANVECYLHKSRKQSFCRIRESELFKLQSCWTLESWMTSVPVFESSNRLDWLVKIQTSCFSFVTLLLPLQLGPSASSETGWLQPGFGCIARRPWYRLA